MPLQWSVRDKSMNQGSIFHAHFRGQPANGHRVTRSGCPVLHWELENHLQPACCLLCSSRTVRSQHLPFSTNNLLFLYADLGNRLLARVTAVILRFGKRWQEQSSLMLLHPGQPISSSCLVKWKVAEENTGHVHPVFCCQSIFQFRASNLISLGS